MLGILEIKTVSRDGFSWFFSMIAKKYLKYVVND